MSMRAFISAVIAFAALVLVALAPTGAAAHGSVPHAHGAKHASDASPVAGTIGAVQVELRAQAPVAPDDQADTLCGDRGCCSAGHCSGCGTALAPSLWSALHLSSDVVRVNPNAAQPAGLAREGPPRPPKPFV